MEPATLKTACFGKLQQALSLESQRDRAKGRAVARAEYKLSLEAEEEAVGKGLAGTLRSGNSRSEAARSSANSVGNTVVPVVDEVEPLRRWCLASLQHLPATLARSAPTVIQNSQFFLTSTPLLFTELFDIYSPFIY
jgi:hypothetical protein